MATRQKQSEQPPSARQEHKILLQALKAVKRGDFSVCWLWR